MPATDLCLKTGTTCAATATFEPAGEIWRVCDTKIDGFGVRLYIQVKRQPDRVMATGAVASTNVLGSMTRFRIGEP